MDLVCKDFDCFYVPVPWKMMKIWPFWHIFGSHHVEQMLMERTKGHMEGRKSWLLNRCEWEQRRGQGGKEARRQGGKEARTWLHMQKYAFIRVFGIQKRDQKRLETASQMPTEKRRGANVSQKKVSNVSAAGPFSPGPHRGTPATQVPTGIREGNVTRSYQKLPEVPRGGGWEGTRIHHTHPPWPLTQSLTLIKWLCPPYRWKCPILLKMMVIKYNWLLLFSTGCPCLPPPSHSSWKWLENLHFYPLGSFDSIYSNS